MIRQLDISHKFIFILILNTEILYANTNGKREKMLRRESADIDENFCPSSLKSPSIGCLVCHKVSKAITDTESGEIICSGCGVVFTEYSGEHP